MAHDPFGDMPGLRPEHHGPVKFSPDGARIAVGYRNVVTIYSRTKSDETAVTCKGHTNAVRSACWSLDGRTLLTASADGAVAFRAGGLLGAATGADGKVVVWDA